MKLFLLLGLICFSTHIAIAQTDNMDVSLGIVMPQATDEINEAQLQQLEAKITHVLNSRQVLVGYYNDFVVYPTLSLEESAVADGGMQSITVTTIDMQLTVRQISTNMVFNAMTRKIKGSGSNKEQSVTNAISRMNTTDNAYTDFISTAKTKIIKYYNDNCSRLVKSATVLETNKDYEQAISILQSIPYTTPCYKESEQALLRIYVKYQNANCEKNLSTAKGQIAVNNYDSALAILNLIEPTSNCTKEANKLIAEIAKKTDKKEKSDIAMDKLRLNAIKEIGKAYYGNKAKHRRG